MSSVYEDIHRSLLAFCNDFITANPTAMTGFQVFDFDTHAVEQELPESNLIGIIDYGFDDVQDLYEVSCGLMVCTFADDQNLTVLRKAMGLLSNKIKVGEQIPIKNAAGATLGSMTFKTPISFLPVGKSKNRPIQAIGLNLGAGYVSRPY